MNGNGQNQVKQKKASLNQQDVPAFPLKETLRIAHALSDELGKKPSPPLQVAAAIGLQPTTGKFRMLASASIAYGLTEGSAWAEHISLTPLGKRAVAPTDEGDDMKAMREAVMQPRVMREFLTRYSGSKWPREDIGKNVLEDMGVPSDQAIRALEIIHTNAADNNMLVNISGAEYVNLSETTTEKIKAQSGPVDMEETLEQETPIPQELTPPSVENENKRVFITHGKNRDIVNQIKVLLEYGDFEPVVAVENQANAIPLSDKVTGEMRTCTAAIIHVGVEKKLIDAGGNEHQKLNDNVLIEIGAALALYDHRFILLVEEGVKLPSNLDGLYQVKYKGTALDHDSTLALLKAFSSFKRAST